MIPAAALDQHTAILGKTGSGKTYRAKGIVEGLLGDGTLKGPQQRILDAVAMWHSIGVKRPSVAQVAFVAGIKPTGGHFSNSIGPLVTGGYLERTSGEVSLTPQGLAAANIPDRARSLAEYHANIRSVLTTGAQRKLMGAVLLCAGRGGSCTVAELGKQTSIDPAGGHFSNSIGPLSTLGLIERRGGVVYPTDLLFPGGLR